MASAHIEVNGTQTRHNGQLRAHIDAIQRVVDESDRLKAMMDQAAAGQDWASLATLLGVPAADAEALYNLIGSSNGELHGPFTAQLLSRAG